MELYRIIDNLQKAQQPVEELIRQEDEIIEEEVILLSKFVDLIYPFATKKRIHGKDSVLIYVYENSNNLTMSDEVYLHPDGYITYQIYNEREWKGYAPYASVKNGFCEIRIDYFLRHKPLSEIIKWFVERPTKLLEQEYDLEKRNEKRRKYLQKFKDKLAEL